MNKLSKIVISVVFIFSLALPQLSLAARSPEQILGDGIRNPLTSTSTISFLITLMKNVLIVIVVITIAMVVYGGIRILTSAGSEASLKAGKQTVLWALIGFAVALLAFSIIAALENFLAKYR